MEEKRVLHLTLKKKWFDMIASGEKKEEYREIKSYWVRRLIQINYPEELMGEGDVIPDNIVFDLVNGHSFKEVMDSYFAQIKPFTHVVFKNGYGKKAPFIIVEFKGVYHGDAKPEWSDNWQGEVFIIKLGNIINQMN